MKGGLAVAIFHGLDVALITLALIFGGSFGENDIGGEDLVGGAVLAL